MPLLDEPGFNPYAAPACTVPRETVVVPGGYPAFAGFWRRAFALALDYGIVSTTAAVCLIAYEFSLGSLPVSLIFTYPGRAAGPIASGLIIVGVTVAYFLLLESSRWQATPGKWLLGLRVIDLNGRRISPARAGARTLGKYASVLSFWVGFLMTAVTPEKQALHDVVAGTRVVVVR